MVEITFTNPSYLWVLILIPFITIIHFFTLKQTRASAIKFSNFEAIARVAQGDMLGSPYKGLLKNKNIGLLMLRALVYCLLIFSVAGAIVSYQGKTSNLDYVFAIDASSSMLADDFTPTRLEAAKDASLKFVDIVPPGAEVGITTFASTAIINLRPTSNMQEVRDAISDINLHESGGTAIGDPIVTSTNLFNTKDSKKSKSIILLTDGQSNVGVPLETATEYAKHNDVNINAIGVATKEGGNVSSLNLISKLDEELLKKITSETNGQFFVAKDAKGLVDAFRSIAASSEKLISINISWILLISVIVILGIEWILINTLYKTVP